MCLTHSVGLHGRNARADVKIVQALLNMQFMGVVPKVRLPVDGHPSLATKDMIGDFQTKIMHMQHPDKLVSPAGATLKKLRFMVNGSLTADALSAIMTNASSDDVNEYLQPLMTTMAAYEINTPLRMAHFLAQVGTESADLQYSEEIASGAEYEGRTDLGNTEKGDGVRFKGRGLIQLTGRSNYTAYGKYKARDFVTGTNSTLISDDDSLVVDVAGWFWMKHDLNDKADNDDLRGVTHRINKGYKGLDDRRAHLIRAKCLLVT